MYRVAIIVGLGIPPDRNQVVIATIPEVRIHHLGNPLLNKDELILLTVDLHSQRIKVVLLQPIHDFAGVIIRQPFRLWAGFEDVGRYTTIGLIMWIIVPHDFQVFDGHVGKGPLWCR